MDKLKYIKIENDDGSLSENIPIGVDAENVDVGNEDLSTKLNRLDANDTSYSSSITSLNSSITSLSSQVSNLASGSPAGVYATVAALTSADPDHNKIYVVTNDGHWYYYNNGWQDGGVYQSVEIENNSINLKHLNNNLKNMIIFNSTENNFVFSNHMKLSTKGAAQYDSTGTRIATESFYSVKAGTTISADDDDYKFAICEYSNNSSSSFIKYSSFITGNNFYTIENDCYIRIAMGKVDNTQVDDTIKSHLIVNLVIGGVKNKIVELDNDINTINLAIENINSDIANIKYISSTENNFVFSDNLRLSTEGVAQYDSNGVRIATRAFYLVKAGSIISVDSNDYKFAICEYSSDNENSFVKYSSFIMGNNPYTIENNCYIRIAMGKADNTQVDNTIRSHLIVNLILGDVKEKLAELDEKTSDIYSSVYDKKNNFGSFVPHKYIEGLQDNYSLFNSSTQYSDYITAFDALINNYSDYITKSDLGISSDDINHLYLYHFLPNQTTISGSHSALKNYPKIIITGGQHGFEKSSPFGLYYFIKDLLENYDKNESLEYIRNNIELLIVPIVNPYGFNNFQYKNANGVNLNRNYDHNWILEPDETSSQYGGAEPFDQPESTIIKNLVEANTNALFFIDFHTNGGWGVNAYNKINWLSLSEINDQYYERLIYAGIQHLKIIQSHFKKEFLLNIEDSDSCGMITCNSSVHGLARNWVAHNKKIIGLTFEGFNGFPQTEESYTSDVKKANSELIANWLIIILNEYFKK